MSDEQNTTEDEVAVVALDVTVDSESEDITHVTIGLDGGGKIEVHIPRGMEEEQMRHFQGVVSHLAYILDGVFDSLNSDDDDKNIVVVVG